MTDSAVPPASPAQADRQIDDVGQQSPIQKDGTSPTPAQPGAMEAPGAPVGTASVAVHEVPAPDLERVSEPQSASESVALASPVAVEQPALSDTAPPVVEHAGVPEVPDTSQRLNDVVMTPIACDNQGEADADQQIASLAPSAGPSISAQVQTAHQTAASAGRGTQAVGGHDSPALDLSLSQVPALQVVDNPLQAVTPVAFGSQLRSQVTESPAPPGEAAPQGIAASAYGTRSPRPRRTSVHVTVMSECVNSPRATASFSVGGCATKPGRASQPTLVLQPRLSPLCQGSVSLRGASNAVTGPESKPSASRRDFALNSQRAAGEELPATFQPTPIQFSNKTSPGKAPTSLHAGSGLAQGSTVIQPPVINPAALMENAMGTLANAPPMSIGPTSAGPQWCAHTPILHDEGDDAEEEGMPAWSSDGGSPDENAPDGGGCGAQVPEDQLPFCDERTGANVVDMHELEPHETPSPLPEGVWPQVAEQAAAAELSGQDGVPADTEGNRSTSSTPKFCEGALMRILDVTVFLDGSFTENPWLPHSRFISDVVVVLYHRLLSQEWVHAGDAGGTQDFSQPVSRMPTITLPLMDSQQTSRSPLADCHPVDTDIAVASQDGLPMILESNSQSVQPGAVLSPVEVDQRQPSAEEVVAEPVAASACQLCFRTCEVVERCTICKNMNCSTISILC